MGLQRAPVQKFEGLNTVEAPYDLAPGQASVASNVRPLFVDDDESIEQRGGVVAANTVGTYTGAGTQTLVSPMNDGIVLGNDTILFWAIDSVNIATALWAYQDGVATISRVQASVAGFAMDYASAIASGSAFPWQAPGFAYLIPYPASPPPVAKTVDPSGFVVANLVGTNIPTQTVSLVYWRGRLVCLQSAGLSSDLRVARILYSNVGDPTNWGNPINFIDIYDQTDSVNCALIVHNNNLYLMKQDSVWMIFDPNTFANRLVCSQGMGFKINTRGACSCPYDRRLYWFDPETGLVWSTNGETDLVCENKVAPITTTPLANVQLSVMGTYPARVTYDPFRKSILVAYQTNPAAGPSNDRVDEISLRGQPGSHPIFRHTIRSSGLVTLPQSRIVIGSPLDVRGVFDLFGYKSPGTGDNGVAFQSQWMGGWMPIISEEPWERIRRVNMLYHGSPTVKVASAMTPQENPAETTITPSLFTGAGRLDRTYVTADGPNKKGRYHRLNLLGPNTIGQDFAMSAVEFAIRGGKEKK